MIRNLLCLTTLFITVFLIELQIVREKNNKIV